MIAFCVTGLINPGKVNIQDTYKMMYTYIECLTLMDEDVQVNGISGIGDMTGYTLKHQAMFDMKMKKISSEIWQVGLITCNEPSICR